ncbi:hypothetical protein HDV05_008542 [Chytridiales sp. JEL 0842]|nr:hypothetical protein HDV05_008542 [Chytridiales sp. JEL 0842]
MAGRLNDNEVAQEMNKMVSFIKQEALEKAREIKVKADEEFNIEKAKLVRQETIAIEAFYQKKMKQADVARKIAQSNHVNKNRLRVLQARQQVLNDLLLEAKNRLSSLTQDEGKYVTLLKDLLLQSYFQMMEPKVAIHCRKKDVPLVERVLADAAAGYKAKMNLSVEATIDTHNPLPENSAGGIIVSANDGKIRLNNTLEARLEILSEVGILLSLTQFYSDIYMKRNFKLLTSSMKPDAVVFLGDIMDGGREWTDDSIFDAELQRLENVFPLDKMNLKGYYIAGNHDIGFGKHVVPHAYERFVKVFGPENHRFSIANHTFLALDTISLSSGDPNSPFFKASEDFLASVIPKVSNLDPIILLTHVPLYRPDGSSCGPLRNKPTIRQGAGYQYQNLIVESISSYILSNIRPKLVLSGDDHDDCVYNHKIGTVDVVEHSIATFSWLQGNHFPGFAVMTLTNPKSTKRTSADTFTIEKCWLAPQIRIYMWYIALLIATVVGCFALAIQEQSQGYSLLPLQQNRPYSKEDKKAHISLLQAFRQCGHSWRDARVAQKAGIIFLQTLVLPLSSYALLILYDSL